MKRVLTISLVLMVALSAAPAMAAKGGKPRTVSGTYEVELDGVLTGLVTMTGNVPGTLRADPFDQVGMNLPIVWQREYDAGWGFSAGDFLGEHGVSQRSIDNDAFGGLLSIGVDGVPPDLTVTYVTMRFDYYWQFGADPKNGRSVQEWLELFELRGYLLGTDEGTFEVTYFLKEGKDILKFWEPVGTLEQTDDVYLRISSIAPVD